MRAQTCLSRWLAHAQGISTTGRPGVGTTSLQENSPLARTGLGALRPFYWNPRPISKTADNSFHNAPPAGGQESAHSSPAARPRHVLGAAREPGIAANNGPRSPVSMGGYSPENGRSCSRSAEWNVEVGPEHTTTRSNTSTNRQRVDPEHVPQLHTAQHRVFSRVTGVLYADEFGRAVPPTRVSEDHLH